MKGRLRVEGLTDEESVELPVQSDGLDSQSLADLDLATMPGTETWWLTWSTARDTRQEYEELDGAAKVLIVAGIQIRVASLDDIVPRRNSPGVPNTLKRSPSSTASVTARRMIRPRANLADHGCAKCV